MESRSSQKQKSAQAGFPDVVTNPQQMKEWFKMNAKRFSAVAVILLTGWVTVLSGCSAAESPSYAAPAAPEAVAEAFYRSLGYLEGSLAEVQNPLADDGYRESEYLTEGFVQRVAELIASFDRGGYDPFLCAQDLPGSTAFEAASVSGEEARVAMQQTWNPGTEYELVREVEIALRQVDGEWKIDDVVCPDPTADWQRYEGTEYGFRLRYPQGWTYEILPPAPEGMEIPDGMKALQAVLIFQPEDWEGVAPPLNVEVTQGTQEEFDQMYVSPDVAENVEINGYPAVQTTEDLGSVQISHIVFHSPGDDSVRIVLTDYISGFPERAEGNQDVIDLVQQIVHTVEFAD